MRAFIITLVLFALLLGAITVNYTFVRGLATEMKGACATLQYSPDEAPAVEALCSKWHSVKKLVQITANHTENEAIDNALAVLSVSIVCGPREEFEKSKLLLINAFEELLNSELLTITNIL